MKSHDPYAALRDPNFRLLFIGIGYAATIFHARSVAIGWEIYKRTGSSGALGLVGLVMFLPMLFLALPAGHLADRYSHKLILITTSFFGVLTAFGLAAVSGMEGPVSLIYALLFLSGITNAIASPAGASLLPALVDEKTLANAVSWQTNIGQLSTVIGPALGGWMIALLGRPFWIHILATMSQLFIILLIFFLKPRAVPKHKEPMTFKSLLTGFSFVRDSKIILAAITLDLFAVLLGGATALLPVYASDILQVGPVGLGWLQAAPAVGALAMGLIIAHSPPFKRAGIALLIAVLGFGVSIIVFGLSKNFFLSLGALALSGAFDNISVVIRATLLPLLTPPTMRGRVSAVNSIFLSSSNQLGAFESGTVAHFFGPVAAVVSGGIGTILVVLATMKIWPEVKRLKRLDELKPMEMPHA